MTTDAEKAKILTRLRRIEGQLRGIQRMVEEDKSCLDILTQVSSVVAATEKAGLLVLEHHLSDCLKEKLDGAEGEEATEELVSVVGRLVRP